MDSKLSWRTKYADKDIRIYSKVILIDDLCDIVVKSLVMDFVKRIEEGGYSMVFRILLKSWFMSL